MGKFYKILASFWFNDDNADVFEQNIGLLDPLFQDIKSCSDEIQFKSNPQIRQNVIRVFYILRGLFSGAFTHKNFSLLFDWFYPQHFEIIEKSLAAFIDDNLILLILKFLQELLDNSTNRLRFDTWNINGLIIFKESSKFMIQLMDLHKGFAPQDRAQDGQRDER